VKYALKKIPDGVLKGDLLSMQFEFVNNKSKQGKRPAMQASLIISIAVL
jgi:hypothetical protein